MITRKNKYLITGGSGFIGTNLINFLINEGVEIMNVDINTPKLNEHISFWQKIDICDKENFTKVVKSFSPNVVIHLAARTDLDGVDLSAYEANIEGVKNLLSVLNDLGTVERVVFTSSMYVCRPGYSPANMDDYLPHTVYGESKVLTESIIKSNNPTFKWCIIRPTSIWGPYFGEPYNQFFKIVLSNRYFHLGERSCKKTYGYIDNFIYQLQQILSVDSSVINTKTYYLGDYDPYDIAEWADEIASLNNSKIIKLPFFFFKLAAWFGDFLKRFNINFPMTTFRLTNMTTNNIHDLSEIRLIAPNLPIQRREASKTTINWMLGK